MKLFEIDINSINWIYERINDKLILNIDDNSIVDICEIVIISMKNEFISKEVELWNIKLTKNDISECKPIHFIYHLTGGDKVWKFGKDEIWKDNWTEMNSIFLESFETKIMKMVSTCKTLGDIKNKITKSIISIEDFYELGLKMNKVKNV